MNILETGIGVAIIAILGVVAYKAAYSGGDKVRAVEAAETAGFTNVELLSEHRLFEAGNLGCREGLAYLANAVNSQGKQVELTLCQHTRTNTVTIRH